ncbi:hypothetical protein [Brevundimonas sp.]|uniref:hypothetical protein n=1 Tax=Brevundimonas sp. TaxID=1871086 RepID=UPI0025BCA218|nr:hypothetical protein [Brevundimonas sp.]
MMIAVLRMAAVALLLAGCRQSDSTICQLASGHDGASAGVASSPVDEPSTSLGRAQGCLRRAAYREARSSKSANYAAEEALRRCADLVTITSAQAAAAEEPVGLIDEHFNLVRRPRLMAEERERLFRFALDRVIEKRSGICR